MSQTLKEASAVASAVASAFREALDCCVALSGVQVGEHSPWAQQVPFQRLKTGPESRVSASLTIRLLAVLPLLLGSHVFQVAHYFLCPQ